MGQEIFQVDAFTNQPFAGNPAAVCVLPQPGDASWMQNVAQEMNLSETAFLHKQVDGFNLCWFTPATEVDLCGHATLASAYILWEMGYLQPEEQARFHTRSGLLTAKYDSDWIELDFPAKVPTKLDASTDDLIKAVGATPKYVGKNQMDYLLELDSEETVRNLKPNFSLLKTLPVRGVIVTSKATEEYDFVSRFFAPGVGIDEDPVTGSAHCCLAPYWRDRLGKDNFIAYQASARGGVIKVSCRGERVLLSGQAVLVLKGELQQPATMNNE